ncbi:MAG: trkD [Phenylobacterium sp.]|nr:trkD [Phenylobacterium sp.]
MVRREKAGRNSAGTLDKVMSAILAEPDAPTPQEAPEGTPQGTPKGLKTFLTLAVASAGVVYGDIGTSPLYAFKQSIAHLKQANGAIAAADVIGVV